MTLKFPAVLLVSLAAASAWGAAPPVKPNPEAATDAMSGYLKSRPEHFSAILAKARQSLEAGALRAPQEERAANVLLKRGLTGVAIQSLLSPRSMELVSFEAKVPQSAEAGGFMTFMLGQRALTISRGTIEDLVDKTIGGERYRFLQMAQQLEQDPASKEMAAEYKALAMSFEFAVYRIEVIGTRAALFSLLRDPTVSGVFVNEDASLPDLYRRERKEIEASVISVGPLIHSGRIDPNKPLPKLPYSADPYPVVVVTEAADEEKKPDSGQRPPK